MKILNTLLGGSVVNMSVSRRIGMGVPWAGAGLAGVPWAWRRSLAGETPKGVIGPLRREPSKSRENLQSGCRAGGSGKIHKRGI